MTTPVSQEELPILEAVISIRNRLTALKKDRGDFIKPTDVNSLYQAVIKQVTRLNDVRDDASVYNNRLDTLLADTKEAPATYSQLASMRQILVHMDESSVYNESDLAPFRRRLNDLHTIIKGDSESGKHPMTKLLERQLCECETTLNRLQDNLSVLSAELVPLHERLITIRRRLVTLAAKGGSAKAELKPLQEELRKIDSKRVDGKFLGPGGNIPASQAICSSLLEECFDIAQEIRAQEESKNVALPLKPIHDRLTEIRAELEGLALTHRWTLRRDRPEVDKMRIDGKFVDSEGNRPAGQYVLLYLLRRCYGVIYRLLSSSEPVSEELMPIVRAFFHTPLTPFNQLEWARPINSRRMYQLALYQIDSLRQDGKFIGIDGSIPEGQGIVMAHLNECHELLEMLKQSMDNNEDDEEEFTEDDDGQGQGSGVSTESED
ncbi:hypothetical protein EDB83DRAFT_2361791 [Lactarius deliciosus]|nr:hypothetical protein EDB83DRAFT_2361791 [Lactarius deliciosus]